MMYCNGIISKNDSGMSPLTRKDPQSTLLLFFNQS